MDPKNEAMAELRQILKESTDELRAQFPASRATYYEDDSWFAEVRKAEPNGIALIIVREPSIGGYFYYYDKSETDGQNTRTDRTSVLPVQAGEQSKFAVGRGVVGAREFADMLLEPILAACLP